MEKSKLEKGGFFLEGINFGQCFKNVGYYFQKLSHVRDNTAFFNGMDFSDIRKLPGQFQFGDQLQEHSSWKVAGDESGVSQVDHGFQIKYPQILKPGLLYLCCKCSFLTLYCCDNGQMVLVISTGLILILLRGRHFRQGLPRPRRVPDPQAGYSGLQSGVSHKNIIFSKLFSF